MSRSANKPRRAKKAPGKGLGTSGLPESVILEVRKVRGDVYDQLPDRGLDRTDSNTIHGLECSVCGELGDHVCLPILHEMIEQCPELADAFWQIAKRYEEEQHDKK